ncbi:uncharacterized protein LOC114522079 [Dendronephthya gigantea]|uniref:uncharacterized protein LOC114522079 n=1 Tax=Dendronephthya gigantea TaxID=151771 RepID=UPI001069B9B0|nr:uncharacterized protein LOC114522079 [Dendronephthya gigantea]
MFGTRAQGKVYNFVHADEIWKDHVIRELQSQKKWTEQWGYLFEEYQKLQENLLNIGSELEEELEMKQALELAQNLEQNLECSDLKLEEVEGIPLVARQGLADCTVRKDISSHIARLQENAKGKNDILKMLQWPREGVI